MGVCRVGGLGFSLTREKQCVRERERVRIEWRESKLFEEPWLRRYWSTSFSFSAIELLIFLSKISLSLSLSLRVYAQSTRCTQEILVLLLKQHAPNKRVESCVCMRKRSECVCVYGSIIRERPKGFVSSSSSSSSAGSSWQGADGETLMDVSRSYPGARWTANSSPDERISQTGRQREACINRDAGTEGDWTDSNPRAALFRFASYTRPAVCAGPSIWNEGGTTSSGPCINQLSSWRIYQ
jgi:hypothetical protein